MVVINDILEIVPWVSNTSRVTCWLSTLRVLFLTAFSSVRSSTVSENPSFYVTIFMVNYTRPKTESAFTANLSQILQ